MSATTSFYAPPENVRGEHVHLPESEAGHAARVLRLERGAEVQVVDGTGTWYRVRLEEVSPERVVGRVIERERDRAEPPYRLVLEVGLIKQRSRFETLLEKSVELGAAAVRPILTRRTETDRLRIDRCRRVMIAALKQSRRCLLPDLHEPVELGSYLEGTVSCAETASSRTVVRSDDTAPSGGGARPGETASRQICLLAHRAEEGVRALDGALPAEPPAEVRVLVGPEGGFAPEEVRLATEAGYRPVHLGIRRLRTETAAIAVAATVSARYE